MQGLKARLRGTWVHRTLWNLRNRPPGNQSARYDWQTVQVMFRALDRSSNCLDIGAHTGTILRHIASIAPKGKHRAFEPLPHLAAQLSQRFPQVIIHQAALSDRSGEAEFFYVENDPAYSGLQQRVYDRPDPRIVTIRVPLATLDDIIPENEHIDFIKIDVEGGEFHAIKGGMKTIRREKPVIVFEAGDKSTGQYGVSAQDFYSLLTEGGYRISTMERWLNRKPPYASEEFARNWISGPDYYFIAVAR